MEDSNVQIKEDRLEHPKNGNESHRRTEDAEKTTELESPLKKVAIESAEIVSPSLIEVVMVSEVIASVSDSGDANGGTVGTSVTDDPFLNIEIDVSDVRFFAQSTMNIFLFSLLQSALSFLNKCLGRL